MIQIVGGMLWLSILTNSSENAEEKGITDQIYAQIYRLTEEEINEETYELGTRYYRDGKSFRRTEKRRKTNRY